MRRWRRVPVDPATANECQQRAEARLVPDGLEDRGERARGQPVEAREPRSVDEADARQRHGVSCQRRPTAAAPAALLPRPASRAPSVFNSISAMKLSLQVSIFEEGGWLGGRRSPCELNRPWGCRAPTRRSP